MKAPLHRDLPKRESAAGTSCTGRGIVAPISAPPAAAQASNAANASTHVLDAPKNRMAVRFAPIASHMEPAIVEPGRSAAASSTRLRSNWSLNAPYVM